MRRLLLIFTVLSVSGCSQGPAQQPAQLPKVVKVEMPPTNPWVHLVELVVPGIIGAGIAFLGVWWTNKRNAAENAANREHQLRLEVARDKIAAEAKSRDNRWAFRKDVYVNLISALSGFLTACSSIATEMKLANQLTQQRVSATEDRALGVGERLKSSITAHEKHGKTIAYYVSLSPIAIAEDVVPLVTAAWERFKHLELSTPELIAAHMPQQQEALGELLRKLQIAGRKDLWGTPEDEAKDKAAT